MKRKQPAISAQDTWDPVTPREVLNQDPESAKDNNKKMNTKSLLFFEDGSDSDIKEEIEEDNAEDEEQRNDIDYEKEKINHSASQGNEDEDEDNIVKEEEEEEEEEEEKDGDEVKEEVEDEVEEEEEEEEEEDAASQGNEDEDEDNIVKEEEEEEEEEEEVDDEVKEEEEEDGDEEELEVDNDDEEEEEEEEEDSEEKEVDEEEDDDDEQGQDTEEENANPIVEPTISSPRSSSTNKVNAPEVYTSSSAALRLTFSPASSIAPDGESESLFSLIDEILSTYTSNATNSSFVNLPTDQEIKCAKEVVNNFMTCDFSRFLDIEATDQFLQALYLLARASSRFPIQIQQAIQELVEKFTAHVSTYSYFIGALSQCNVWLSNKDHTLVKMREKLENNLDKKTRLQQLEEEEGVIMNRLADIRSAKSKLSEEKKALAEESKVLVGRWNELKSKIPQMICTKNLAERKIQEISLAWSSLKSEFEKLEL